VTRRTWGRQLRWLLLGFVVVMPLHPLYGACVEHVVTSDAVDHSSPEWSPDSAYLLCAANGICKVDVASEVKTVIVADAAAEAPTWSGDGAWVAFLKAGDVYKVPAAGGTAVARRQARALSRLAGRWARAQPAGVRAAARLNGPIAATDARAMRNRYLLEPFAKTLDTKCLACLSYRYAAGERPQGKAGVVYD